MVTYTVDSGDGSVRRSSSVSWSDARTGGDGNYSTTYPRILIYDGSLYYCERGYLSFDTSGIPFEATITAATIRMKVESKSATTPNAVIVDWTNTGQPPTLAYSDFTLIGSTKFSNDVTPPAVDSWAEFTLNAAGIANINTYGYSNFAVINEYYDFDARNPPTSSTYTQFYTSISEIVITYEIPDTIIYPNADTDDGIVYTTGQSTWSAARDVTSGFVTTSDGGIKASDIATGATLYGVQRGFIVFDGTDLGSTSGENAIISATLNLYVEYNVGRGNMYAQEWVTSDFTIDDEAFDEFGKVWVDSYHDAAGQGSHTTITLNNDSVAAIQEAFTNDSEIGFILRSWGDYNNDPPSTSEYNRLYFSEYTDSNKPYLSVEYGYLCNHNSKFTIYIDGLNSHNTYFRIIKRKILSHTNDAYVQRTGDISWQGARNTPYGNSVLTSGDNIGTWIESDAVGGWFAVRRSFIPFDTSNIPDGATITSATLHFFVISFGSDGTTDIGIYEWDGGTVATIDDYNDFGSALYGNTMTPKMGVNSYPFNATGIAAINDTGYTNICIRDYSYDVSDVSPSGNDEYMINIRAREYSTYHAPYLEIEFIADDSSTHNTSFNIYREEIISHNTLFEMIGVGTSNHHSTFDIWTEDISTHGTEFLLYGSEINTHNTSFLLWAQDINIHNSEFTIYLPDMAIHNTNFLIYPPTVTIESHLDDTSVYKQGTTWAGTKGATDGDGTSTDLRIQVKELGGIYTVQRTFLAFDTSIVNNPIIYFAKIRLRTTSETPVGTPNTVITTWNTNTSEVNVTDYSLYEDEVTNSQSVTTADTWYEFDLNTTGMNWIISHDTGFSGFALLEYTHDHENIPPTTGQQFEAAFSPAETAYEPELIISYVNSNITSHYTSFAIGVNVLSSHRTQFILYATAEAYHRTAFDIYVTQITLHSTNFIIYDELLSSHHTRFHIGMISTHNTIFSIYSTLSIHNTLFDILLPPDTIQYRNREKYKELQLDYYPEWLRPESGTILNRLNEGHVEETYNLIQTIEHIINLLNIDEALVASGDGANETLNSQLNYLIRLLNRERWEDETDTHLRQRLVNYVTTFYGGGKLDQYQSSLQSKYPTLPSKTIKIDEPLNPYPSDDTFDFEYKYDRYITYLEQPPDQIGWINSETIQGYLIGGDPPNETGIWKVFRFVDARDIASFKIDILNNYSAMVNDDSDNAAQVINDDKCLTPFAGVQTIDDTDLAAGIFYIDEDGREYNINELNQTEDPFFFSKTMTDSIKIYDSSKLIKFVMPITTHYSRFLLWTQDISINTSIFVIEKGATRTHHTTFTVYGAATSSHSSEFDIISITTTSSHNTVFNITTTIEVTVDSGMATLWRSSAVSWADARNAAIGVIASPTKFGTANILSTWRIFRLFLAFDTSTIPDSAIISAATLSVRKSSYLGDDIPIGICQKWTGTDSVVDPDDYDDFSDTISDEVTFNAANTWFTFTFNTTGLSWVSTTGDTRICMREKHDVDNDIPIPLEDFSGTIYDQYSSYKPKMTITYY